MAHIEPSPAAAAAAAAVTTVAAWRVVAASTATRVLFGSLGGLPALLAGGRMRHPWPYGVLGSCVVGCTALHLLVRASQSSVFGAHTILPHESKIF